MKTIEITINEVAETIGVSENTLYKNFKICIPKLEQYGILYEGKGKKRKFYKIQKDIISNENIAYEIFEQIVYNAWGFDRRIDIFKLLHFMSVILITQTIEGHTSILSNKQLANIVNIDEKTIRSYKEKLIENEVIMPSNLSKVVTYASLLETEIPTITSELRPNINNRFNSINQDPKRDNFNYSIKLVVGDTIKQEAKNKIVVPNDIFDSYLNACKTIANTKNLRNKYDYEEVENLILDNKKEFKITEIDKYIAFQNFKKELGIDKLYQVYKTEYSPNFMKDTVLLDIIVKSFKYIYPDSRLNEKLLKYDMQYIQMDISELHEQGLKEAIPF